MWVACDVVDMSQMDTKDAIVRTLRNTDEPALSAQKLAEELDVSVRTINNHVDGLERENRIATSQIGNATAYYIPASDLPAHKKPDHTCARCGREVNEIYDYAKIETEKHYEDGSPEVPQSDFYIFCRFCESDLFFWIKDPANVGEYSRVHSWDIPTDQLEEVRDNPDIETTPGTQDVLEKEERVLLEFIEEMEGEFERGVPKADVLDRGEQEGELRIKVKKVLSKLENSGFVYQPVYGFYKSAK